jgi:hypothetical protein
MAATFDPTLPSQRDHIRLHLGDKHDLDVAGPVSDALLQDEVIDANLREFGFAEALARLADALAVDAAQRPNEYEQPNGVKVKWSYRVAIWQSIAKQARAGVIPVPGAKKRPRYTAAASLLDVQRTFTDPLTSDFRSD